MIAQFDAKDLTISVHPVSNDGHNAPHTGPTAPPHCHEPCTLVTVDTTDPIFTGPTHPPCHEPCTLLTADDTDPAHGLPTTPPHCHEPCTLVTADTTDAVHTRPTQPTCNLCTLITADDTKDDIEKKDGYISEYNATLAALKMKLAEGVN